MNSSNIFLFIIAYVVLFGAYYWFTRKQRAGNKEAKERLNQLKRGDHIVTIGGLHGIIEEINQDDNTVVLNCDDIFLKFERRALARVVDNHNSINSPEQTEQQEG